MASGRYRKQRLAMGSRVNRRAGTKVRPFRNRRVPPKRRLVK